MFFIFFILVEGWEKKLINLSIVFLFLFISYKSTARINFAFGKVFKVNYLGVSKEIKPIKIFVLKLDTGNRFFLQYETLKKKKKKVFLSGEPEDFIEVFKDYKDTIIFSKKFQSLVKT